MNPSRRVALLGALVMAATLAVYAVAARPAGHRAQAYLAVHLALLALMLAGWRLVRSPRDVDFAVAVGVLARLALVGVPSFTTTDVGRYLWDGAVSLSGRDPYALPPLATELASLAARVPMPLDHCDVATCYPPAALALFSAAAAFGPSLAWWAWKLLVAAASSLTVWVAWRHLRGTSRARDVVLAAWSPVLILEAGVGAHLDVFTALAITGAVVMAERRREDAAALLAGSAAAIKLVPGVVALALSTRARRPVWFLALAAAPLAVSMALSELMGLTAPGSLPYVAENWSFAAPLWTLLYEHFPLDDGLIRAGLALGGLAAVLALSLRRGAARNARDALSVQLVTSPALYPWYGSPLAAVSALAPSWWALSMLAAIPCSYEVLDGYQSRGVWAPAWWPVALNAAALVGGLGAELTALAQRARRWLARRS